MLAYALAVAGAVSTEKPVVVIGKDGEALRSFLGDDAVCVLQDPPLGTGHAVQQAEAILRGQDGPGAGHLCRYAAPAPGNPGRLVEAQKNNPGPITMLTVIAADPRGFGRVIRAPEGRCRRLSRKPQRHRSNCPSRN